jgi:crossover junction endodeoxyribonuclease RuvC
VRILGIDPGIGRMGWGVIDSHGGKLTVQTFGCIETPTKHAEEERIKQIYEELTQIVEQEQLEAVAIEELFFSKNVTTAFSVGQARGIALLVAAQHNLSVTSYNPGEVKLAVTGYGKAEKRQVGQMVKAILHLERLPKLDDTTDALAIALTHAFTVKGTNATR